MIRGRQNLIIALTIVAVLVISYPPAIPWMYNIRIEINEPRYTSGETVVASAYIVNDLPFPIRVFPYQKFDARLEGLGATAATAAMLDWGGFGFIYIKPFSRYPIFEDINFHPLTTGKGILRVTLYSVYAGIATGTKTLEIDMGDSELSETGRKAVQAALEYALIQQRIPDYHSLAGEEPIVLSNELLGDYQPSIEGVNLTVLSPMEIQEKADREGDFLRLKFESIKVLSDSHVTLELSNMWILGADSENIYLSGGGFTLNLNKVNGVWEIRETSSWIS